MSLYKRRTTWWYRFRRGSQEYRGSTQTGNRRTAETIEADLKRQLALGRFNLLKAGPAPTLAAFLQQSFLPYVSSQFAAARSTSEYYRFGARLLKQSSISKTNIDAISSQQTARFIDENRSVSASYINQGLRTLRRALKLAAEWGKIQSTPKIALAKGERRRERLVSPEEEDKYLAAAPEPWKTVAMMIRDMGMRPGEVIKLRWEDVFLDRPSVVIREGKTEAARRTLPMSHRVKAALTSRFCKAGLLPEGWVFPSKSETGHLTKSYASRAHGATMKAAGLEGWVPYNLRHTALTELAQHTDAFTLMKIAGHSSVTMTQRYTHPQTDSVTRAFAKRDAQRQRSKTRSVHEK